MRARSWAAAAALITAVACGAKQQGTEGKGMPEEQAKAQCEQIKQSEERCWNDQVTAQCAACLVQCGLRCGQAESCPIQFNCPP